MRAGTGRLRIVSGRAAFRRPAAYEESMQAFHTAMSVIVQKSQMHCLGATVCKTVPPMLSDSCPVCLSVSESLCLSGLSVTLMYCGVAKRFDGSR